MEWLPGMLIPAIQRRSLPCVKCSIIHWRMAAHPPTGIGRACRFATACGNDADYGHCIQSLPREFYGGIETDKVGQLGAGYALFYELTGDSKYLGCGNPMR